MKIDTDTTGLWHYLRYGGNVYQQAEAFVALEQLEKENKELKAGIEWDDKDELIVHLEADKNRLEKENDELRKLFNNLPKYEDMPLPIQDEENYKKVLKFWLDTVKKKLTQKEV